jgi:puromycin-sensitive aminopeptidase
LTFDDNLLLIDAKNSSESQKLEAARIISHEIAHQWFGNLVTMEWRTHLWLNEGFASYIENLPIFLCFPEWKVWNFYVGESQNLALQLDSLSSSHPIEVEVYDSAQIDEIFDDIAYKKGSSIIRMLAGYLGQETFKEGLHIYLTKYQYQNTITEDLWRVFDHVSNKKITKMMTTWTKQVICQKSFCEFFV